MLKIFALLILDFSLISANGIISSENYEDVKCNVVKNIILASSNRKEWITIFSFGNWPNSCTMEDLPFTFATVNENFKGYPFEDFIQYRASFFLMECENFEDFEKKVRTLTFISFWHPHSNTIVYYRNVTENNEIKAKIFFAFWYYKSGNVVVVQNSRKSKTIMVTYFNQYISENFKLEHSYGCWTRNKVNLLVRNFERDLICTKECHNVTVLSPLRANHLGTCVGFQTTILPYYDNNTVKYANFFEDKSKNMNKFPLRAFGREVKPFLVVDKDPNNGSLTIGGRDGLLWLTLAEVMNFTIDLSPNADTIKNPFDFEFSIVLVSNLARRMADILLFPIYLFDLIVVEVDMSVPFKDSGLCFLSHRADFETSLFDVKLLQENYTFLIEGIFVFFGTWSIFFIFNSIEKKIFSLDQAGKDLVNAIRHALLISLYRPPKKGSFKIFLFFSIWSFFVLNFATQAVIISFFSAFKRGKEVDTFEDVVEKGYKIEGLASPDNMLPESEERFSKINAKLVPIQDLFGCATKLVNDSKRFCLIDCSVGRYVKRNQLDAQGEQFLHIAKDQIHSFYLTLLVSKYSAMTDRINEILLRLVEGGLILKWEQYRFVNIKDEAPVKSLDMKDLSGIFKCYLLLIGFSTLTFLVEVCIGSRRTVKKFFTVLCIKWKKFSIKKKLLDVGRYRKKVILTDSYTQT